VAGTLIAWRLTLSGSRDSQPTTVATQGKLYHDPFFQICKIDYHQKNQYPPVVGVSPVAVIAHSSILSERKKTTLTKHINSRNASVSMEI
jgi:hypothetical protein